MQLNIIQLFKLEIRDVPLPQPSSESCSIPEIQDTGLSFQSPQSKRGSGLGTPGGSGGPTPSKLLLMRGERQMNVLSPEAGTSLHQVG